MKRDRHDQLVRPAVRQQWRHVARHCACKRDLAAIFQPDRQSPGDIVICDRSPGALDARRHGKADRAMLRIRGLERKAAGRASGIAQKGDMLPAIGAEAVQLIDDRAARRAPRRKREIEHFFAYGFEMQQRGHHPLVAEAGPTHKPPMADDLFDMKLRALRRDRAARLGPALFLHERALEDCLERLQSMRKYFRSALLIGCPDPDWPRRLRAHATKVDVVDPGHLFARAAGGEQLVEDAWTPEPGAYDLCLAIGTLDSVNELPRSLLMLRFALADGGLLLGALSGGNTLPRLRAAMRAADDVAGAATPHVHPRIDPSALAGMLVSAGFNAPVIDVDRVSVSYPSFDRLVDDLRRMGGTNLLRQRSRAPLNKAARAAAVRNFAEGSTDSTEEVFEILHFLGWNSAK